MQIENFIEITCDGCGCAEHYNGKNKSQAIRYFKNIGCIFYKDKYFCNEECKSNYLKAN